MSWQKHKNFSELSQCTSIDENKVNKHFCHTSTIIYFFLCCDYFVYQL